MAKSIERLDVPGSGAHKAFTLLLEVGTDQELAEFLPGISERSLLSYIKSAAGAGEYRPLARLMMLECVHSGAAIEARDMLSGALTAAMLKAYRGMDIGELEALKRHCERLGEIGDGDREAYRRLADGLLPRRINEAADPPKRRLRR